MIVSMVVRLRPDAADGGVAGVVEAVDDGAQFVVRSDAELLDAIRAVVARGASFPDAVSTTALTAGDNDAESTREGTEPR